MSEITIENIQSELVSFETRINEHHDKLNQEAIWLFVATLGTWSVKPFLLQLFALFIVLYFYYKKVFNQPKSFEPFPTRLVKLKLQVEESSLNETEKKALYFDLNELERKLLKFKSVVSKTPFFLVGFIFWVISFIIIAKPI